MGSKTESPWYGQQKLSKNLGLLLFVLSCHWRKRSYPCYGGLKKCSFVNLLCAARHSMGLNVNPHGMEGQQRVRFLFILVPRFICFFLGFVPCAGVCAGVGALNTKC